VGKISVGIPVFEFGISFSTEKLLIGAASLPVFAPIIKERSPGRFNLQPERHYVLHGKYQFKFGDYLALTPGVLLKSDLVETQAELATMAVWKDKFIAGVSYRGFSARSTDAVVIMAGLAVNEKTTVVYAYDIPMSGLQNTNRGSHELMLRYNFNKPLGVGKLPPIIYNPRFLN
jgi:type IX secretion system PorP/SprF family membrane protein